MPVHVAEDPLTSRGDGRRQVRRGVRGTPAGPGLGASAVLTCGPRDLVPPDCCVATARCAPGPDSFDQRADRSRLRSRMVALVLACLTLMTARPPHRRPLAARARAAGGRLGVRPGRVGDRRRRTPGHRASATGSTRRKSMQHDIASLEAQNSRLRAQNATGDYDPQPARGVPRAHLRRRHARLGPGAGPRGRPTARRSPSRARSPSTPGSDAGVHPDHDRAQRRRPGRPGARA